MKQEYYKWTKKDKWFYIISMIPLFAMLVSTFHLLTNYSIFIAILWIFLYLIVNVFQAGCCVGCPYRRSIYCTAFCGAYLGKLLSNIFYKNRQFNTEFFIKSVAGGEIALIVFLIFPLYWVYFSNWYFILLYLGIIAIHFVLFTPVKFKKCSYSVTCSGGKTYQNCCQLFRKMGNHY